MARSQINFNIQGLTLPPSPADKTVLGAIKEVVEPGERFVLVTWKSAWQFAGGKKYKQVCWNGPALPSKNDSALGSVVAQDDKALMQRVVGVLSDVSRHVGTLDVRTSTGTPVDPLTQLELDYGSVYAAVLCVLYADVSQGEERVQCARRLSALDGEALPAFEKALEEFRAESDRYAASYIERFIAYLQDGDTASV